jgi:hypothetical protein
MFTWGQSPPFKNNYWGPGNATVANGSNAPSEGCTCIGHAVTTVWHKVSSCIDQREVAKSFLNKAQATPKEQCCKL